MAIAQEKAQHQQRSSLRNMTRPMIGRSGPKEASMTTRTRRETIVFAHPFRLRGIDRELPAGAYDVITDEELIEGLSFPVFRRVATMITVPCAPPRQSAVEMLTIEPDALRDARQADSSTSRA